MEAKIFTVINFTVLIASNLAESFASNVSSGMFAMNSGFGQGGECNERKTGKIP